MTVSSVEVIPATLPAGGASATPTITTTLRASDRVVVMLLKSSTSGTPSISGLGATWTNHVAGTATLDHYLWSATGLTGTGVVTVANGGTISAGDCVVWVLRSSVDATIVHHGSTEIGTSTTGGTPVSAPDIIGCDVGMFAIGGAVLNNTTTLTFPHANSLPATGWNLDDTGDSTTSRFISRQLSASGTVRLVDSASGTANHALIAAVFSDGDTGALPPITSTFIGWGVDAGIA